MDNFTSDLPQLVVAGRFLTGQEEERWQRTLHDPVSKLLCVVLGVLLIFFSIQAAGAATQIDWRIPSLVVPLMAGCLWFLIARVLRARRRKRQALENAWLERWQDHRMIRAGSMISLYRDRAVYSTMRGSSILPYTQVTHCVESVDGILLGDGHVTVCFRGADMTAQQLFAVRRFLQEHVSPSVYRVKESAVPLLSEPLPNVRFANYDTVITRATVIPTTDNRDFHELLGIVLPQMIIYGLTPALMTALTPWPLLNCVIFCGVFMLLGALITHLAVRLKTGKQGVVRLAFTKEGVAKQQNGAVSFAVRGRYQMNKSEAGVTVLYATGERLDIPWSAIEDPDALNRELP
ncbi:MAG: hypothetical protein IJN61_06060 [Clostridia bacterium]|nr:hypothetical protein [Clostridia bacterium]